MKKPFIHPTYPMMIHSSVESVTGLISVGEALTPTENEDDYVVHSARYLRAAHSLLGGVWTSKRVHVLDNIAPLIDVEGKQLGDPIYATFVVQEAVRLVNSTEKGAANKLNNVLTMYAYSLCYFYVC
jgi:hypothetical protein